MQKLWPFHLDLSIGDTVYYVLGDEPCYSIRKTRITKIDSRKDLSPALRIFSQDYTIYITEDGAIISPDFRHHKDELSPEQVFLSMSEAVQYIIDRLKNEIRIEKSVILSAQERLSAAERVLKSYQKSLEKITGQNL